MKNKNDKSRRTSFRKALTVIVATASLIATLICLVLMLKNYPGMNIAFCIALAFSIIIFTYILLRALRTKERYSKLAAMLQRCFLICIVVCIVVFIILQCLIISGARTEAAEVGCLIVLGAGIYGETPSRILAARLDAALEYLKTRGDVLIIVSGGQGSGEAITEAEAMFRYLVRRGANENRIWKEESSASTWENLAFSLELMEENGLDIENTKVAIVTNEFHLYRAKHIAGTLGFDAIGIAAETPYPSLRILYHCREALALLKSLLSGWKA